MDTTDLIFKHFSFRGPQTKQKLNDIKYFIYNISNRITILLLPFYTFLFGTNLFNFLSFRSLNFAPEKIKELIKYNNSLHLDYYTNNQYDFLIKRIK